MTTSRTPLALSLLTAVTLSACSNYSPSRGSADTGAGAAGGAAANAQPAPPPAVPCDARPAQSAVGQASTASVMESARARSGARMARVLRPGQMVTKEFNNQRLNLEVDASGRIISVRCG